MTHSPCVRDVCPTCLSLLKGGMFYVEGAMSATSCIFAGVNAPNARVSCQGRQIKWKLA